MSDQIIHIFLTVRTLFVPVRCSNSVDLLFHVLSVVFYFLSLSVFPFFIMCLLHPASVPLVSSVFPLCSPWLLICLSYFFPWPAFCCLHVGCWKCEDGSWHGDVWNISPDHKLKKKKTFCGSLISNERHSSEAPWHIVKLNDAIHWNKTA